MNRVRRTESDWRALLARFAESGLSRTAFCKQSGIPASTFQLWERKLRAKCLSAEFVDVTPVAAVSVRWSIEIVFPDGTTARVRG
jgi:hypothetical protein